jgi:hypothetical protein
LEARAVPSLALAETRSRRTRFSNRNPVRVSLTLTRTLPLAGAVKDLRATTTLRRAPLANALTVVSLTEPVCPGVALKVSEHQRRGPTLTERAREDRSIEKTTPPVGPPPVGPPPVGPPPPPGTVAHTSVESGPGVTSFIARTT